MSSRMSDTLHTARLWLLAILAAGVLSPLCSAPPAFSQTPPEMPPSIAPPAETLTPDNLANPDQAALADAIDQTAATNSPPPPPVDPMKDPEFRGRAFDTATNSFAPLSPEEISRFLKLRDDTAKAKAAPATGAAPRTDVRVETINLDPGAAPPQLKLHAGYVSTLGMLDQTGQPWPVLDVAAAGPFQVDAPADGGHIMRITPLAEHAFGNISIRLKDFTTPVVFTITAGGDTVDFRVDARIPRRGPNAATPLMQEGPANLVAGDATMMTILEGVAPPEAERIDPVGADSRTAAWLLGDRLYLRTPLTLLSPGWSSSVGSADGTTVYALRYSPVLILTDQGVMTRVRISRRSPPPAGAGTDTLAAPAAASN